MLLYVLLCMRFALSPLCTLLLIREIPHDPRGALRAPRKTALALAQDRVPRQPINDAMHRDLLHSLLVPHADQIDKGVVAAHGQQLAVGTECDVPDRTAGLVIRALEEPVPCRVQGHTGILAADCQVLALRMEGEREKG